MQTFSIDVNPHNNFFFKNMDIKYSFSQAGRGQFSTIYLTHFHTTKF